MTAIMVMVSEHFLPHTHTLPHPSFVSATQAALAPI